MEKRYIFFIYLNHKIKESIEKSDKREKLRILYKQQGKNPNQRHNMQM